jgi:hypothetical protein
MNLIKRMVKNIGLQSDVKIVNLLVLLSSFLLISCEDVLSSHQKWEPPEISWNVNPRLEVDNNDFYHLTIDTTRWQTLHRFSGSIKYVSESSNQQEISPEGYRFEWESSHYWYIGDTLGYIVKRGLTDQLEYVTYDTIYVTGFNGMEVPTINPASYSNGDGEFNQMFAPVKSMRGDTVTVTVARQDYFGEWQGVEFYVVLD